MIIILIIYQAFIKKKLLFILYIYSVLDRFILFSSILSPSYVTYNFFYIHIISIKFLIYRLKLNV